MLARRDLLDHLLLLLLLLGRCGALSAVMDSIAYDRSVAGI